MKRLENRRDVRELGRLGNSSSSGVENELQPIKLRFRKIEKKRITVVKFRVYKRSGDSFSSRRIKGISDATNVTNRRETGFRHSGNVIRHR
jgi:hypothetical protein